MRPDSLLPRLQAMDGQERHRQGWLTVELDRGQTLVRQDDPADTLYVVATGSLSVRLEGVLVDHLGPGATLGEASAFFPDSRRRATVVADQQSQLWALPGHRLRALRAEHAPAYDTLLSGALSATWSYLSAQSAEIAKRREHIARPSTPLLQKLWRRLRGRRAPEPDRQAALARVPALAWLTDELQRELGEQLVAVGLEDGEALYVQGDAGDALHIVVSGRLAVLRDAGDDQVAELAEVGPGALLGVGAHVAGEPRSATVVARGDAVLLALPRELVPSLVPPVRRALDEALLATLRAQLDTANQLLARLASTDQGFGTLLDAVRSLEAWQAGAPSHQVRLDELAQVSLPPEPEQRALFETIRTSVIGGDAALETPYGLRRIVYADYTASGRSLRFIEDFLREQVMPLYANTHTEASASGLQTTRFREEARTLVGRSLGAGPEDEVLFVGSGATGAVNKLIDLLALRKPMPLPGQPEPPGPAAADRPVVFIGPYEHHSNILPWRHCHLDLVTIPVDGDGLIDLSALEQALVQYRDRPLRIGSFSAGSNVTGVATDVHAIATLLHRHGALSFWDYAAAGPYVPIEMNPEGPGIDASLATKDAVFLSPHKFVGGPGTPGVLVLKKHLVQSAVPTQPGGGTVDFVTPGDTLYSDSITHREEAGTPAILESIRCGLVFQLKDTVGGAVIHHREQQLVQAAIEAWSHNPAIHVLGPRQAERLSITSFMVRHGRGFLHHNFIVAVLNDVFGIQARGGCSCAGPYGAVLLGMGEDEGAAFLRLASCGLASIKPGWARVNFNYFISDEELRYVVQAVNLVALHGWALMPDYRYDVHSGLWHHRAGSPFAPASLTDLRLEGGTVHTPVPRPSLPEAALARTLEEGRTILAAATRAMPEELEAPELDPDYERHRWFPLPHEVAAWLRRVNGQPAAPGDT